MTCPRPPPVKSLAIEPPHCTRDYPAAPNLLLHMLGGGQPRPTSPASPLFSQATLKTACVSPGPLRCNHQGGVKHAKIFMPMGRTNWKGAQNAGEPCQTSKQVLPHVKKRGKEGTGWKHPRLPQHLRKFQQGSSQSHRQRSPGILAYLVTGWQPPRGKHGLSTNILLWIPELSTRGHRSTMIPLLRGLRGTIATLPCSRLPLTPVGQNEKRVAVNKRVSTGCFLVLEY